MCHGGAWFGFLSVRPTIDWLRHYPHGHGYYLKWSFFWAFWPFVHTKYFWKAKKCLYTHVYQYINVNSVFVAIRQYLSLFSDRMDVILLQWRKETKTAACNALLTNYPRRFLCNLNQKLENNSWTSQSSVCWDTVKNGGLIRVGVKCWWSHSCDVHRPGDI